MALFEVANSLNAVHTRHLQIHQDNIGYFGIDQIEGLLTIIGGGDHVDFRVSLQDALEPFTDDFLVVGYQYFDHTKRSQLSFIVVPTPGWLSTSRSAPIEVARSCMPCRP